MADAGDVRPLRDVAVTTMSASPRTAREVGRPDRLGHTGQAGGVRGERVGALGMAVVDREPHAGQERPQHRGVGATLDPGADEDRPVPGARSVPRHEEPHGHAAERRGARRRDRVAVHDRDGRAGRGVIEDDERCQRGEPARPVARAAADPLHAQQVGRRAASGDLRGPQARRHRPGEDALGSRRDRGPLGHLRAADE